METTAQFTLSEGGTLAHALACFVAREVGTRVLSIKGPFAAEYGLRAARVAADADVLVDPIGFDAFCHALRERGWHTRVGREAPTFMGLHSVTLINDAWPCDIDVHSFFPGFLADPQRVFEMLWAERAVRQVGSADVLIPSASGMAVIVALHAERTPSEARSQQDLETVGNAIRHTFTKAMRDELQRLVIEGRAQWILHDLLESVGVEWWDDASSAEKRLWQQNRLQAIDKSAALWLSEIRGASLLGAPVAVLRAMWVPRVDIPRNDPSQRPGWKEGIDFNVRRWARGARALLSYSRHGAHGSQG